MKAAKEDKEKCLADQKAIMTREREFAVAHAHSVEQVEAARKLSEMKKRWLRFFFFFGIRGNFNQEETKSKYATIASWNSPGENQQNVEAL